jgi:hypothetical protein
MNSLKLSCRLDKCIVDTTLEMEIKKCTTQLKKETPDRYDQCPYLIVETWDEFQKGDVWRKFGDMIDKSKPKNQDNLP